jgi:hypothetical protein
MIGSAQKSERRSIPARNPRAACAVRLKSLLSLYGTDPLNDAHVPGMRKNILGHAFLTAAPKVYSLDCRFLSTSPHDETMVV